MPTLMQNVMPKLILALALVAVAGLAVVMTIRYDSVADALAHSDGYSWPDGPANLSTAHTADSIPMGDRF